MDNCLSQYLNGLDENFLIVMYYFLKLCTIGHMLRYKRQWENWGNTSGTIDVGSWWVLSEAIMGAGYFLRDLSTLGSAPGCLSSVATETSHCRCLQNIW